MIVRVVMKKVNLKDLSSVVQEVLKLENGHVKENTRKVRRTRRRKTKEGNKVLLDILHRRHRRHRLRGEKCRMIYLER